MKSNHIKELQKKNNKRKREVLEEQIAKLEEELKQIKLFVGSPTKTYAEKDTPGKIQYQKEKNKEQTEESESSSEEVQISKQKRKPKNSSPKSKKNN